MKIGKNTEIHAYIIWTNWSFKSLFSWISKQLHVTSQEKAGHQVCSCTDAGRNGQRHGWQAEPEERHWPKVSSFNPGYYTTRSSANLNIILNQTSISDFSGENKMSLCSFIILDKAKNMNWPFVITQLPSVLLKYYYWFPLSETPHLPLLYEQRQRPPVITIR